MINDEIPIGNLGAILVHEPNPLPIRLYALNLLREKAIATPFTYETLRAVKSIAAGLYSESLFLKQKCIQALGESRSPAVVPFLQEQLAETENNVGCRVEAAKGLALMRHPGQEVQSSVELLTVRFDHKAHEMVRDAAEVAAARLGWEKDREDLEIQDDWYGKLDFAPPLSTIPDQDQEDPVTYLISILLSENSSLFTRCRAMISLRNFCIITYSDGSSAWAEHAVIYDIVDELTRAVHQSKSAFMRYEMVMILGQIGHQSAVPYLKYQARNRFGEDERVRNAAWEVLESFDGDYGLDEEEEDEQADGAEGSESEESELSEEEEILERHGKDQLKFLGDSEDDDESVFAREYYALAVCKPEVSAF